MSNREDRLRSLLDKVRAKRPDERPSHAVDAVERLRTASGTTTAVATSQSAPAPPPVQPTTVPSSYPTQTAPSSIPEPPTTPGLESPTRYSSQPPRAERPLSVEPRISPSSPPPAPSEPPPRRHESIRPQSVAPTGQPVVYSTEAPEFPRPKTFGELLELTLSLRPR